MHFLVDNLGRKSGFFKDYRKKKAGPLYQQIPFAKFYTRLSYAVKVNDELRASQSRHSFNSKENRRRRNTQQKTDHGS